ncbi:c-type cytochrome [Nitrosomonas mobilis]|uniref:Putative cytochrome c n=1 Tax=Nitrosomonas mobilis TaxID=51642 RepID=A0A1G5SIG4_9PROT|nr:cytochrome C [Nitrosomonas mobilis]SCZ86341.1 putative cytochrome c [Nitrosomonas mobilis]HNO74294.1 cytochrome c4 [Nitrosomonas mobilis]
MRLLILSGILFFTSVAAADAPVEVADTIAERVKSCMLCHGDQDKTGLDAYYPRITGKPAGYLFNQLRNFRDGRRYYQPMAILLENLTDEYLQEMAEYFAAQPYNYPLPRPHALPSATVQEIQVLVDSGDATRDLPACSACHGADLMGVKPFIPGLLGLPSAYLAAQFGGWRNGGVMRGQVPNCMSEIARKLSQEEVNALALWLPAQAASGEPAEQDVLAPEMVERCQSIFSARRMTKP